MSAELLRRTAAKVRDERGDLVAGQTAGFWDALADILDHEAERVERSVIVADGIFGDDAPDFYKVPPGRFLRLARAYLGEEQA